MKSSLLHIILYAALLLAALILPGCVFERDADLPECPAVTPGTRYLSLQISLNTAGTRGNDEAPEGRLPGTEVENAIHNLTLFFINTENPDNTDNTENIDNNENNDNTDNTENPDNTINHPFSAALYIDFKNNESNFEITGSSDGDYFKRILIKLDPDTEISDGQFSIVTVANMGDLSDIKSESGLKDMHSLRRMIVKEAWKEDNSEKVKGTCFAMSSFDPVNGGVISSVAGQPSKPGTKDDPYFGECHLMRLAARIDLCCNSGKEDFGKLIENGGKKEIEYQVKKNDRQIGSLYLLSAVPVNTINSASYALRHTISSDIPESGSADLPLNLICGGLLDKDKEDKIQKNYVVDPLFFSKTENTPENELSEWYSNRPASVRENVRENKASLFSGKAEVGNFIVGKEGGDKFDTSLTIGYVNENTFKAGLDPMMFATGVVFRTQFVPETVYSSSETVDDNKSDYQRGKDFWVWKPDEKPGDTGETLSPLFFSNDEAAQGYRSANGGSVTHHPEGISYYNIWIRHNESDDGDDSGVMDLAIVRNNVYRILLNFSGPGSDEPFKEKPVDVTWKIFTREWNIRWQPEIIL